MPKIPYSHSTRSRHLHKYFGVKTVKRQVQGSLCHDIHSSAITEMGAITFHVAETVRDNSLV